MPIFIFPHYKSVSHSNQSSYPIEKKKKKKHYSFPRPIDAIGKIWKESASWLQRRCHLKMLTDDDGRTTDASL